MIIENCSRDKIRFEIESRYEDLKDDEILDIKITKAINSEFDNAFDLDIIKRCWVGE